MKPGFNTRSIHAGEAPDPTTGAHGSVIHPNTTFEMGSWERFNAFWEGDEAVYGYTRDHNPTCHNLETKIASLEGAERGLATASGMAAISSTLMALAAEGHVVAADRIYNTSNRLISDELPSHGLRFNRVDITDLAAVEAAIVPDTRVIYTEVFSNPGLEVADIDALAEIAHRHHAKLVIDNTFLSPALMRPIEHGADVVVHSATKYLAGHGEVVGGVVSADADTIKSIRKKSLRLGNTLSPISAWMIMTGMRTLPLRMERHSSNGLEVANFLARHPMVESISYPGLPGHPRHEVAKRLLGDKGMYSGMMSMRLQGGMATIPGFAEALELVTFATSLGDTASLCWPIYGTDVVRLSIGLENAEDIIADLEQALAAVG